MTAEQRLIENTRALISYARQELPETILEGGILHDVAAALVDYERTQAASLRSGAGSRWGEPPAPGRDPVGRACW
jgi:hypothetical protein